MPPPDAQVGAVSEVMFVTEGTDRSEKTGRQKALELNLERTFYGSVAEIGAGQEVARHFFQAGGASGTIAKTVSAYDMQFSDAIYGAERSGRYVTRTRLMSMLDKELDLVIERVAANRSGASRFFAFADTVAAKSFRRDRECHGWMGIKFQHVAGAEPSRIMLHVRMQDTSNQGQQEVLGLLGVNLVHAACFFPGDVERLVDSLVDGLDWGRIEVDYINFAGPCYAETDNRSINLRLVSSSLSPVVMIGSSGDAVVPAELMWGKDVLLLRGTFRPFLTVHADMIERGQREFARIIETTEEKIEVFCEMNVARALSEGLDELHDLEERVIALNEQGRDVMVTSHLRYFRLSEYFSRHAERRIGFLLSVNDITTIFDDRYYDGLDGGILTAMGKLFASNSILLVHPTLTPDGEVVTTENVRISDHLVYLYKHLISNERILPLTPPVDELVPFRETP